MKKVAFHNLGCKVNSYEIDGIMQMFQKRGYKIVDFAQKSDIYVINTCTVTNIADRKSRQMIHRAKAQNPEAVVVATGCYVQTDTDGAVNDECIDIAVGNNHKAEIVDIVEKYLEREEDRSSDNPGNVKDVWDKKTFGRTTVSDLTRPVEYENISIDSTAEHTRAFIKIQDGCNQFCSYCAIPLARGRVRSRNPEDIISEVFRLAGKGYKEVVLTGIHLSSYGLDENYNSFAARGKTNTKLLDVIENVNGIEGIERIRLGSLEPRLLTEEFTASLSKISKLCPHFHLSLQSGCDEVLKRMNRHYDTKEFKEKVRLLRRYFDHPAVTTDIIVGFPGESDEEFEITRQYLEEINLYECHIFKYSRRSGTVADKMQCQMPDAVKQARSRILIEDSQRRERDYAKYYCGKKVSVLLEDTENHEGEIFWVGYTPEYVKCCIKSSSDENLSGKSVQGYAKKYDAGVMYVDSCVFGDNAIE